MQQSTPDRNRDEGKEWLKYNQGKSATTAEKRTFALQTYNNLFHNYGSTTSAKQLTICYSLFSSKGPFQYLSNY